MSGEQPETEPVVGANGETFIPGTGKFANYYKPESGGPWYELRDGAMVKAKFPPRGPKWWRRLPGPLRTTLLVVLAINLAIPMVLWYLAGNGIFSVEDGVDTPTKSDAQILAEQIKDVKSSTEIQSFCAQIKDTNRGDLFKIVSDMNPQFTYDEALVVTDAYEIICEKPQSRMLKE